MKIILFFITSIFLCSCSTHRVNFLTKTSMGFSAEPEPLDLDLGYSRTEIALAPAFSKGKTASLFASFNGRNNLLAPEITSIFSSGKAAEYAVLEKNNENLNEKQMLENKLNELEELKGLRKRLHGEEKITGQVDRSWTYYLKNPFDFFLGQSISDLPKSDERIETLLFTTDTEIGLSARLISGGKLPYINFGFARREFSSTPLLLETDATEGEGYWIHTPSTFAYFNSKSDISKDWWISGLQKITLTFDLATSQVFATGNVAEELTKSPNNANAKVKMFEVFEANLE